MAGQPVVSGPGPTFSEDITRVSLGTYAENCWVIVVIIIITDLNLGERVTVFPQAYHLHYVSIVYDNLLKIQAFSYREILINRNIFIDFQILEI